MTEPATPRESAAGPPDAGTHAGSAPSSAAPTTTRHHGAHPSSAADPARTVDPAADDAALDAVMRRVPRGALTLAAAALLALLAGWLLLYFLVFLARGGAG